MAKKKATAPKPQQQFEDTQHVKEMYENYFLDYASYVITDRAVPYLNDGLKPVQRRILHSLFEMNDGRFHKAANVIGNTMKYHPHGDAGIRDALVNLGQKYLMIDLQGNWGDPITGDAAAAPRYIECKASPFALEVGFNKKTTEWRKSYDGRNDEPDHLPVKFPLLLAQGAEGIAVGLATKILPHNFCELINASIKALQNKPFKLVPDFITGGSIDASEYNNGKSGGKVKTRATIKIDGTRTLTITEIPFGTTTQSLMESIVSANDKGKIKIRKIEDNTAGNVELIIHLPTGADPDKAIDALYKFTECEHQISVNCCVIRDNHPIFVGVNELLRETVKDTVALLKRELEIKKDDLEERLHFRSLEQVFIENRIYRKIEKCKTWESIVKTIYTGLKPFSKKFIRKVTDDDVTRLTEIRIKRISAFDAAKAKEEMISLDKQIKEVKKNLKNLTGYAIEYYQHILDKYGKDRKRRTRVDQFEEIQATDVILSNLKVGYDRKSGFIGTSVRGDNHVANCSRLDDIIVFTEDGGMVVTKVADKTYAGKNILHAEKFEKENLDTIYNMIYREGRVGSVYVKRFAVGGVTRGKHYNLTKGKENSKVFHFSISGPVTTEKVVVKHVPKPRIKKELKLSFSEFEVKGRGSGGNLVTKHPVRRVAQTHENTHVEGEAEGVDDGVLTGSNKSSGPSSNSGDNNKSSQKGEKFFWDKKNKLIGFKVKGNHVCNLDKNDKILILYDDGSYITYSGQDTLEVGDGIVHIDVWNHKQIFSCIFTDGNTGHVFGKRFKIVSGTGEKYFYFISDFEDSKLLYLTAVENPRLKIELKNPKKSGGKNILVNLDEKSFPEKKVSHIGNKITDQKVKSIKPTSNKQTSLL